MFFEQNPDLLFQQHANRFNANIPNHLASVGPNGNESEFSPSKRKSDENSLGQACHHKSPRVQNNQANPLAHLMMMNPQAQQYFSEMFPYEELYNAGQFNDLWLAWNKFYLIINDSSLVLFKTYLNPKRYE